MMVGIFHHRHHQRKGATNKSCRSAGHIHPKTHSVTAELARSLPHPRAPTTTTNDDDDDDDGDGDDDGGDDDDDDDDDAGEGDDGDDVDESDVDDDSDDDDEGDNVDDYYYISLGRDGTAPLRSAVSPVKIC